MESRALVMASVLLVAGCGLRPPRPGAGPVVATYDGHTLRTGDVLAQIETLPPPARAALSTTERKRSFVENLVLSRLLYEEGQALGYAADPTIAGRPEEFRERLVVQKVLATYQTVPPVTDAEARRQYDENAMRYARRGKVPRFERVKEPIRAYLTNRRAEAKLHEHLESLKRAADLRISDDGLAQLNPVARLTPPPAPPAASGH